MSTSSLRLSSPSNFRDLADVVRSSIQLRSGVLFRSDHLGGLVDEDIRQIQALGVARVLDFRGEHERRSAACAVPGVAVHSLSIEPTIIQVLSELRAAGHRPTEAEIVAHMQDTYRGFVRNHTRRYAQFFGLLLESAVPTVFHCTAGKDRTGFAAALLLRALGASQEVVMRDYLLTNERLRPPPPGGWGLGIEVARVLWGVRPEFLQAAWDVVEQDHGSLQAYLREGLGLREAELARLRELYLQA